MAVDVGCDSFVNRAFPCLGCENLSGGTRELYYFFVWLVDKKFPCQRLFSTSYSVGQKNMYHEFIPEPIFPPSS